METERMNAFRSFLRTKRFRERRVCLFKLYLLCVSHVNFYSLPKKSCKTPTTELPRKKADRIFHNRHDRSAFGIGLSRGKELNHRKGSFVSSSNIRKLFGCKTNIEQENFSCKHIAKVIKRCAYCASTWPGRNGDAGKCLDSMHFDEREK